MGISDVFYIIFGTLSSQLLRRRAALTWSCALCIVHMDGECVSCFWCILSCIYMCTFVEEVSVDSLVAATPFLAPRSKIGKLLMQIRLIRGAKRSAEKFRFCGGVGTPEILGPPPLSLLRKVCQFNAIIQLGAMDPVALETF